MKCSLKKITVLGGVLSWNQSTTTINTVDLRVVLLFFF